MRTGIAICPELRRWVNTVLSGANLTIDLECMSFEGGLKYFGRNRPASPAVW
jgi:hypothetical protein